MEGTAPVAVAAFHTVPRLFLQLCIVSTGQLILGPGQIVVFVDDSYIQTGGARLAVVAVDAFSRCVLGCEGPQDGVVLFLRVALK